MNLHTGIERIRRKTEAKFTEKVVVTREPEQEPTFDLSTGELEVLEDATVYEGMASVRHGEAQGTDVQAGEHSIRLLGFNAKLPVDTAVDEDDVLTVIESRYDQGLVGQGFRITDVLYDGRQVARVVALEKIA